MKKINSLGISFVLADATPSRQKEFDNICNSYFTYLGKDILVGDKLCFETQDGSLWYRVAGTIILPNKNAKPNYIIQLKET